MVIPAVSLLARSRRKAWVWLFRAFFGAPTRQPTAEPVLMTSPSRIFSPSLHTRIVILPRLSSRKMIDQSFFLRSTRARSCEAARCSLAPVQVTF